MKKRGILCGLTLLMLAELGCGPSDPPLPTTPPGAVETPTKGQPPSKKKKAPALAPDGISG